ncbi:MAG: HEAT repeat domain-containing protein [Vicinamibacterales bacterium]
MKPKTLCRAFSAIALAAVCTAATVAAAQTPTAGRTKGRQAAEAGASLDDILEAVASYDGGVDSGPLWRLRDYVRALGDDAAGRAECEATLLRFLGSKATKVARMAAARHLRLIAADTAVPALRGLLVDQRTADEALFVLRQIPGASADAALMQVLAQSKTADGTKAAIVAALGGRRAVAAVPALVPYLQDATLSAPAAIALGEIGGAEAAAALMAGFRRTAAPETRKVVAAALLRCAERELGTGTTARALEIYDSLLAAGSSVPVPQRRSAAIGRLSALGDGAIEDLPSYLRGPDPALREAAVASLRAGVRPDSIGVIVSLLPALPPETQVPVLAALSTYPAGRVLPAIVEAARSSAAEVRIAAMRALETTGGAQEVPLLLEAAARGSGPEQLAARNALAVLAGRDVDDAIVAALDRKPPEAVEAELLQAVAERRIFAARSGVRRSMKSSASAIRVRALRTLRIIGTPSDVPAVVDFLLESESEPERLEAERTAAALAAKVANEEGRARAVIARMDGENDAGRRARILGVLAAIGDRSSLPAIRRALEDDHAPVRMAAVRAISSWPTSAARDDAFELARDSRDETERLLAIGGFVRMIGLERFRQPQAAVHDLEQAASFSWRPEEKRLILATLSQFACPQALELARSFVRDKSVEAEAKAAIDKIEARLPKGAGRT